MNEVSESVEKYIRSIRNKAKKEFARKYYAYQCNYLPELAESPELSFMARQAVRLHIDGIYKEFGIQTRIS